MIDWLLEHADVLSALAATGSFLIWLLYLQLFYRSFSNARRPKVLIHQAGGYDRESRCVVANMSESAVHVSAVLVDVVEGERTITFMPQPEALHNADDPLWHTRQGPLASASYLDVGSFDALLRAARTHPGHHDGEEISTVVVRVVGFVGSELFPAGALRHFDVRGRDDGLEIRPRSPFPTELSGRRQRTLARAWLEEAQDLDTGAITTATRVQDSSSAAADD